MKNIAVVSLAIFARRHGRRCLNALGGVFALQKLLRQQLAWMPVVVLVGCFSPWTRPGDEISFVISMNGEPVKNLAHAAAIRAGWPGWDPNGHLSDISHTITLSGGPGPEQTKTFSSSQQISFSVMPGVWNIDVKSYMNGTLIGVGESLNENIQRGRTAPVTITMGAPSTFGQLIVTVSNITYPHGLSALTPIETTIGGNTYSEKALTFTVKVSGFLDDADAATVNLTVTGELGIFSSFIMTDTASAGTKTFTVTTTYIGQPVPTGTSAITITTGGSLGAHYIHGIGTAGIKIADGQSVANPIPVNQNNIVYFNDYAGTSGGLSKHYKLIQNVILNPGPNNWTRIGSSSGNSFTGSFDGSGHTITGLTRNDNASHQGMFGYINGGIVKNLGLINVNITGGTNTGGIVGFNHVGTVENCYVTGTVAGSASAIGVGGVVGSNQGGGTVKNCYATSIVSGYDEVGGVAGSNLHSSSIVENCYATGIVSGTFGTVGGVVGLNQSGGIVKNCYATGNVSIESGNIGGVAGYNNNGTVQNCYATGNVSITDSGPSSAGGVVGNNIGGGTVQNCYATGNVTGYGTTIVSGVVGQSTGTVRNCVALNQNIGGGGSHQRVVRNSGVSLGNYGRTDMKENGSNGSWVPGNDDGANVTTANAKTANWWNTVTWENSGGAFAWAFGAADPWAPANSSRLPILRNMPAGTQNPVVP